MEYQLIWHKNHLNRYWMTQSIFKLIGMIIMWSKLDRKDQPPSRLFSNKQIVMFHDTQPQKSIHGSAIRSASSAIPQSSVDVEFFQIIENMLDRIRSIQTWFFTFDTRIFQLIYCHFMSFRMLQLFLQRIFFLGVNLHLNVTAS